MSAHGMPGAPSVPPVIVADGIAAGVGQFMLVDFQTPDPVGMASVIQRCNGTIRGNQIWVPYIHARTALEYLSQRYQATQYIVTDAAYEVLNSMGILGERPDGPPPPPEPEPPPPPPRARKRKRPERKEPRALSPREAALATLHLLPSAPPELIKAAYKTLAACYHPDKPAGSAERMREINKAWAVLKP